MTHGAHVIRRDDWQSALTEYMGQVGHLPFEFGVHDCALFAAGAVKAMTGVDLASDFRGYSNAIEGLMMVKRAGFLDHMDVFRQSLAPTDAPQTGDVAFTEGYEGMTIGIVSGRFILVAGKFQLERVPLAAATEMRAV